MRELRYGEKMQDYTCSTGYQIKWIFPENIHINKDALYEIEYQVDTIQNKSSYSHVYKITYIKPVNEFIERINFIVNMFNKMNQTDDFEKWFRERYKLLVVVREH